jgi:two-component system response regulator (stage 0 sporulation protein A)
VINLEYIKEMLDMVGMNRKHKGYQYCVYAIYDVLSKNFICGINEVYRQVAFYKNTSEESVERSIRYAIECAWQKGSLDSIDSLFGYTVDKERGKPTNSEFIFLLADHALNIIHMDK